MTPGRIRHRATTCRCLQPHCSPMGQRLQPCALERLQPQGLEAATRCLFRYRSDHRIPPDAAIDAEADAKAEAEAEAAVAVAVVERLSLGHGDLLVLTGRARWDLLHRVLPGRTGEERVSLVFGVW